MMKTDLIQLGTPEAAILIRIAEKRREGKADDLIERELVEEVRAAALHFGLTLTISTH
jgi:hypothetical protein